MFERWEQLKTDLKLAKASQEETVQSWESYDEITKQFKGFLANAEVALQKPLPEQEVNLLSEI